jgi:hypothetical protein
MKKITVITTIVFAIVLSVNTSVKAQFAKGDNFMSGGMGVTFSSIRFFGSYEHGITDNIGAGLAMCYWKSDVKTCGSLVLRGSYHLNKLFKINTDKIDLYGGGGIGYRIIGSTGMIEIDPLNGVCLQMNVGCKYYFNKNLAAFSEFGAGFGLLKLGVSYKF